MTVLAADTWPSLHDACDAGFELVDRFEHVGRPGPQPPRDRQLHARRNHSTLFVFRKRRDADTDGDDDERDPISRNRTSTVGHPQQTPPHRTYPPLARTHPTPHTTHGHRRVPMRPRRRNLDRLPMTATRPSTREAQN